MNRRGFLAGVASLMVAPAIVQASSLMRVKEYALPWLPCDGRIISPRLYPELTALLGDKYGGNRLPNHYDHIFHWSSPPKEYRHMIAGHNITTETADGTGFTIRVGTVVGSIIDRRIPKFSCGLSVA